MDKIKSYLYFLQKLLSNLLIYTYQNPKKILKIVLPFFFILIIIYGVFVKPPSQFPTNETIYIEDGLTLSQVAIQLKNEKVIKSSFLFKIITYVTLNQKNILSGDYYLREKQNLFDISYKVTHGKFDIIPVIVTIPEGSTVLEIADKLNKKIKSFDKESFIKSASAKEGYLFPDTYYFSPNIKFDLIITVMEENFFEKIEELDIEINNFERSLNEIIIMASLVEEEARTTETRRIISGILWYRLDLGIPLQVDAVFPYINGKNTFELTSNDLKIDSPYNTYLYKGLPIGPITNPGLDSIRSTITPIYTEYLFYLSDKDGNMHYSETLKEHNKNKARFLK